MCHFQPIDKQSLLDSGIFCCLIHVLSALLAYDEPSKSKTTANLEEIPADTDTVSRVLQTRRLEVRLNSFIPNSNKTTNNLFLHWILTTKFSDYTCFVI